MDYRHRLCDLIDTMHWSVRYWLEAAYRRHRPALALDSPASALQRVVRELARRWRRSFAEVAQWLARRFAEGVSEQVDQQLRRMLELGPGELRTTEALRDVLHATIHQNVSLIRSIPQEYLADVEQAVMRAVQSGQGVEGLARELERRYDLTRRRALIIASTQSEMATASLVRVRQIELGLGAVWEHSFIPRRPRRTHLEMHGKRFDPRQGMWDSHERQWVFPGQLINCRCRSRPVIP
jgi:uncharacterized protein with gpF-like domain